MKIRNVITTLPLLFAAAASTAAVADQLIIAPEQPEVGNCIPFGRSSDGPYKGFVYQNIPAFDLVEGDVFAFDTAEDGPNDNPIEYDIELAITTVNGGSEATGGFTKIVSNTRQARVPNGDSEFGNFELGFTVEAPFSFPGGGLIIRFSNPGPNFAGDSSCEQLLHYGNPSDSSGYFVQRFYSDQDGLYPYDGGSLSTVGAFAINPPSPVAPPPVPSLSATGLGVLAVLLGLIGFSARRRMLT